MPNSIPTRALPWASAAGVAVLVAGTIASQVGAGAAVAAHPAAPSTAFSTKNMPTSVQKALKAQFESIAKKNSKHVTPKAAPAAMTPTKATKSATKADGFSFQDASYILTIRSAGIEYIDDIPRELQQDQGFSYVDLLHDIGQPQGRCETFGAAYWLGQEVEEGVLGKGAAPPDAGDVSGGYSNPFTSRDVEPNLSAGENQSNRSPGFKNYFPPGNTVFPLNPSGPGYNWTAKCDDDTHGRGQGDTFNIGGFQVIGSTSSAGLDKSTGVYTGTSRAYFAGLDGATKYDGGSSFMQITNSNGSDAKISYRMSYFNSGDKTGTNGISFGGADIPVQQFADAFNSGAKSFGSAGSAIGPMGAATLEPEVGTSTDGGRYSITISAGHGNLGFAARSGGLGQNQEMRIGSVTWQGVYGSNN